MNILTKIGENSFGKTRYSLDGVIPFASFDISKLEYGDSIIDNNGKGMSLCVNFCWSCNKNYLASTLILVEGYCSNSCSMKLNYKPYNDIPDYDEKE